MSIKLLLLTFLWLQLLVGDQNRFFFSFPLVCSLGKMPTNMKFFSKKAFMNCQPNNQSWTIEKLLKDSSTYMRSTYEVHINSVFLSCNLIFHTAWTWSGIFFFKWRFHDTYFLWQGSSHFPGRNFQSNQDSRYVTHTFTWARTQWLPRHMGKRAFG